ncbi:MAG: excinuclease ABC subunit UvrC [Oscillospiraceae bacterium]|nr:excinuclease ABC subunit UvrC [Oscillospiraceae bacterium]
MIETLREKANKLPLKPGVYIMHDRDGQVIYVGKAKQLKNRVSSYFRGAHDAKTSAMVAKVADFEVIIADSEFEALILENSLIKHHMPHYNILLKDDKGYPFIRLDTSAEYPSFSIVSKPADDGARYFGPYGGRSVTRDAINAVSKALGLPTCGKRFPRDIGKARPCLNYHMNACRGYCRPEASAEEYRKAMAEAVMVLEGRTSEIVSGLMTEMENDAENLRFELAAEKRDRIRALQALGSRQNVVAGSAADTDAAGLYRRDPKCCFVVLHYIGGDLLSKDVEVFDTPVGEDGEILSAALRVYYEKRGAFPKEVLLQSEPADAEELQELFSQTAGRKVVLRAPRRGEKRKLTEAALRNATEELERIATREERTLFALRWLREALALPSVPERIEAYDISNTGSSDMVASMTVFAGGRPLKRDYRRFRIKTLEKQDDCRSMAEVITRRMERLRDGDEKFSDRPDLILIDGGEGQLRAAIGAMEETGTVVPAFGMVKDDRHRTRALVAPDGSEVGISANQTVFSFIGRIQEETHRFAIEYHRSLHGRRGVASALDRIEGVGEKRRNALLKSFGSVKAIKNASEEELAKAVPANVAAAVYAAFHGVDDAGTQEDTEEKQ